MSAPISVKSVARSGGAQTWLDQIGQVEPPQYSATSPGGPSTIEFDFFTDVLASHPALVPGRMLYVYAGAALTWAGRLHSAERGSPWKVTGIGMGGMTKDIVSAAAPAAGYDYVSLLAPVDNNLLLLPFTLTNPQTGVTPAAGGLASPGTAYTPNSGTIDDALQALIQNGGYWQVDPGEPYGYFSTPTTQPATATVLVEAVNTPGGRTLDGYANTVTVVYLDNTNSGTRTVLKVAAAATIIALYGEIDATPIDLTSQAGGMTPAQANTFANTILAALNSTAPAWTEPLVVGSGQVTSMTGAYIDPATLPAMLPFRVRVLLVDPDTANVGGIVEFVVGQIDYDAGTDLVSLTPIGTARNDLASLVARLSTRISHGVGGMDLDATTVTDQGYPSVYGQVVEGAYVTTAGSLITVPHGLGVSDVIFSGVASNPGYVLTLHSRSTVAVVLSVTNNAGAAIATGTSIPIGGVVLANTAA